MLKPTTLNPCRVEQIVIQIPIIVDVSPEQINVEKELNKIMRKIVRKKYKKV